MLSLSAGLEAELLRSFVTSWAFALYVASLVTLFASAVLAVRVLWPKEEFAFRSAYLERLPTRSEMRKTAEEVRGETILGLVEVIAGERARNQRKARQVRAAFALLLAGLGLVVVEASILGARTIR